MTANRSLQTAFYLGVALSLGVTATSCAALRTIPERPSTSRAIPNARRLPLPGEWMRFRASGPVPGPSSRGGREKRAGVMRALARLTPQP
jgi:hypothetical protein